MAAGRCCCYHFRWPCCISVALIAVVVITVAVASLRFDPLSTREAQAGIYDTLCGISSTPQDLLAYSRNLASALDALELFLMEDSFAVASSGDGNDAAYALFQCAPYLDPLDCSFCFRRSTRLLRSACDQPIGGRIFLEGCFLRADSYLFFSESISPADTSACGGKLESSLGFEDMAGGVIREVTDRAVRSGGYGFGYGSPVFFAMALCWRSLDETACRKCLTEAENIAEECLPETEFRSMKAGCFFRYSSSNFSCNYNPFVRAQVYVSEVLRDLYMGFGFYVLMIGCTGVGIYLGALCCRRTIELLKKCRGKTKAPEIDLSVVPKSLVFKHSILVKATNSFSASNKLGQGGFGDVYKGCLPDGREIAVKRLFCNIKSRGQEIYNEINIISHAQHKNLVRFLGCSLSGAESLLVYEFHPNRSLDRILFDTERKKELTWKKRLEIILGTAEGIEYLHKRCQFRIIHRDIKASNILLDEKLMPKIADFGLARFFSSDDSHMSASIAGTLGYMAPEYIGHGQLSEKVDVYSFGVLVLEIVSGIRNNNFDTLDGNSLVMKAWELYQSDSLSQLIDGSMEVSGSSEISRLLRLALLCTQELPSLRPSMSLLLEMLKQKDFHLPTPSRPPFVYNSSINNVYNKSDVPLNSTISSSSLDCSELYPR